VSEILALNNHEMLVDERDGKGLGDGSKAKIKQIFKVELADATDMGDMNGTAAASNAAPKTLFLDVVQALTAVGFTRTRSRQRSKASHSDRMYLAQTARFIHSG